MIYAIDPKDRIQNMAVSALLRGFNGAYAIKWVSNLNTVDLKKDLVVCFGVPNVKVRYKVKISGSRLMVVDYGALSRPQFWTVGYDDIMGRGEYYNHNMPSTRWDKLGFTIKPWATHGDHIIIAGQVPIDNSVRRVSVLDWYGKIIASIKAHTNRDIIFRPHPLARDDTPHYDGTIRSENNSLDTDLENAHALVTWNSTSASMSVLKGIPVFAFDRGSIAWQVSNRKIEDINKPKRLNRTQWAYNLAYTQWSMEELEKGMAYEQLKGGMPC